MRKQFPTTPPSDIAQIIRESQCCLVIIDGSAVTAGAACSYDTDDEDGSVTGFLHFLASEVRGQKHGSALLYHVARYLESHGARKLLLDSQRPDDETDHGNDTSRKNNNGGGGGATQRTGNDPVAFYRACGLHVERGSESGSHSDHDDGAEGVPMAGRIDEISRCCAAKLGQTQHVIWLLSESGPEPPYSGFGAAPPPSSEVDTQSKVSQLSLAISKSGDTDDGTVTPPVSPAAAAALHSMHQHTRPRTSGRKRQAPSLWADDPLGVLNLGRESKQQQLLLKCNAGQGMRTHRGQRRAVR
jgi:GNAT superfamily N-acetyltransferase